MPRSDFGVWEDPDNLGYFMGDAPLPWPNPETLAICNDIMAATEAADNDSQEVPS